MVDHLTYLGTKDFSLEVVLGKVAGYKSIDKFGESTNCDNNVLTDIWDGADGVTGTTIWVAPTQARTHNIASALGADDGDPVGTGMRTIRIYGLTDWDTAEVNEDLTLNGTNDVVTSNSYVIIHRMHGLTYGSGGANAGIITATATTDNTITAMILAGASQTRMAIYGVPSVQKIAVRTMHGTILKRGPDAAADADLTVKLNADQADSAFVVKRLLEFATNETLDRRFDPPLLFDGPCILKLEATSDTNDASIALAFDAFVVDN